ncbi:MAG: regulatory YrvL family protein [Sporolactobacillus sp.]|jgi:hypothetical protein|nr:regulatory YrvL family protein [Sporolactobacillus sp.]
MSQKDRFKNESTVGKLFIIASIVLIIAVALTAVFILFYFGFLGLFRLLGIHYDSLQSLLIFTLLFFLLGIFADIFEKIIRLTLSSLFSIHKSKKQPAISVLLLLAYTTVNLAVVNILDYLMNSVSILFITQLALAAVLAVLDLATDD